MTIYSSPRNDTGVPATQLVASAFEGLSPALAGPMTSSAASILIGGHSFMTETSTPGSQSGSGGIGGHLHRRFANATNLAGSGSFIADPSDPNGAVAFMQAMELGANTRTQAPYVPAIPAAFLHWGVNDLISAAGAETGVVYSGFQEALRSVIANCLCSRFYQYDNAAVTFTGTADAHADVTLCRGAGYVRLKVAAETCTWAVPSDFEGGVIQVNVIGRPSGGSNGGTFTVAIDGVTVDTISTVQKGYSALTVPMVRRYLVPTAGAHTVVLTQTGTPTANNFIAGFGIEASPGCPIAVANQNTWTTYSAPWGSVTHQMVVNLNKVIADTIAEFPDCVQLVDLASLLTAVPSLTDSNGAHPNERGAALAAQAFLKAMNIAIFKTGSFGFVAP